METLKQLASANGSALYQIEGEYEGKVERFVTTAPETRAICNDPLVYGVDYTEKLKTAMTTMFKQFNEIGHGCGEEENAVVLHILRGGLNFGLREAVAEACGWNRHNAAYMSSQRKRGEDGEWYVLENSYRKVYLPAETDLIFGDVVATGVSLEHAIMELLDIAAEQEGSSIRTMTFVTIGGSRSEEIMEKADARCRDLFPGYIGSRVVYIEGRFDVAADSDARLQIGLGGTDLLRRDSLNAPEFNESQAEALPYALERCTIYDAGSRAFYVEEYLEDVREYWEQVRGLAENGTTLSGYLKERFPEDKRCEDEAWMSENDSADKLKELAEEQLSKLV